MRKLNIVGLSDFGNSGISETLREPLRHWHRQGHTVSHACLGFNGWQAAVDEQDYPYKDRLYRIVGGDTNNERFGQICLDKIINQTKADIVISSFDVWMVSYLAQPELHGYIAHDAQAMHTLGRDTRSFQHIAYFPIDGLVQNAHLPRQFDEIIAGFDVPVTYSRFARDAVLRDTGMEIPFIPICHDAKVFNPAGRAHARKEMGFPKDKFLVGMVATNQYRKLWGEFMVAAARLAHKYDDVMLVPWTTWDIQIAGGFDIRDLAYRENVIKQTIDPSNHVGQLRDAQMADLYRALDVCVLTTVGEGAGLPPIRARACGTPALVSDNTACREFAADPFELIPSNPTHLDNGSNIQRFTTNVDVLFERLEHLYQNRKFARKLGEKGARAMLQYSSDNVMPVWDALLERVGAA